MKRRYRVIILSLVALFCCPIALADDFSVPEFVKFMNAQCPISLSTEDESIQSVSLDGGTVRFNISTKDPGVEHADPQARDAAFSAMVHDQDPCNEEPFRSMIAQGYAVEMRLTNSTGQTLARHRTTRADCRFKAEGGPGKTTSTAPVRKITGEQLRMAAQHLNARCPIPLAKDASIVSVNAIGDSTLSFRFKVADILTDDSAVNRLNAAFTDTACDDEGFSKLLGSGIAFQYDVVDSTGRRITQNRLEADHCDRKASVSSAKSTPPPFLKETADRQNAKCPINLGKGLTMTSVTLYDDSTVLFRFKNSNPEALNPEYRKYLSTVSRSALISQSCKTEDLQKSFAQGIRFRHEYFDVNDQLIYTATIDADQCQRQGQGQTPTSDRSPSQKSRTEAKSFVETMRAGLPFRINERAQVVDIAMPDDSTIQIVYQTSDAKIIQGLQSKTAQAFVREGMTKTTCSNSGEISRLLKHGIKIRTKVVDLNGRSAGSIDVTSADCNTR